MADNKSNIIIEAIDKTKNVFKNVVTGIKTVEEGAKVATGSISKMLSAFMLNPIMLAIAAFTTLVAGLKKATEEASEAEQAHNNLSAAFQRSGQWSEKNMRSALDYAAALQQTTQYADENINAAQAMLVSYTRLSGEGLNEATQATADLAQKMGIDLERAAKLVGKAIGTNTNPLKRMGIEANGAANSSERLKSVLEGVSSIAGGAAASQMNTLAGKWERFKNVMGELFETIGGGTIDALKPILDVATTYFTKFNVVLGAFVTGIRVYFINLKANLAIIFEGVKLVISAPFKLSTYKAILTTLYEGITGAFSKIAEAIQKAMKFDFSGAKKAAKEFLDGFSSDVDTYTENVKAINEKRDLEIAAAHKKQAGEIKNTNAGIVKETEEQEKGTTDEQKKQADEREKIRRDAVEKSIQLENIALAKIGENRAITLDDEIASIDKKLAITNLSEDEKNKLILDKAKLVGEKRQQIDRESLKVEELVKEEKTKLAVEAADAIANSTKDGGKSALEFLKNQLNKQVDAWMAAEIGKLSMASFTTFGASLAAIGPTIGAGAAAKAAIGAINFAEGGIVPGASYSGDNVPARVNSGEMILNKDQQTKLFDMINSGQGGNTQQPITITLTLDRKVLAKEVIDITKLYPKGLI